MSLVVTGTVSIDSVYTPDQGHREGVLGGSCAYFAAAASFYGDVRMVAVVGDDFPSEHLDTLKSFDRIDLAGLEHRAGSKSFRWGGKYMENMDHRETLFTELNVLEEAPPTVPDAYRASSHVFLANTHPAVQMGMLEQLPDRVMSVADTMDLWIDVAREDLEALMRKVDGLVLNHDEAELFTGVQNPVTAARKMLEFGLTFVIVKKGEHGALLVHRDGIGALPAYPAEAVVDPTGAGDSFAGGMMGHLARVNAGPEDVGALRTAMAHGTMIASYNIESFTMDRMASLTESELAARYAEYAKMLLV